MTKATAEMRKTIAEMKEALRLKSAEQAELAKSESRLQQIDRNTRSFLQNHPHPRGVDDNRILAELRAERETVEARIRQLEEVRK